MDLLRDPMTGEPEAPLFHSISHPTSTSLPFTGSLELADAVLAPLQVLTESNNSASHGIRRASSALSVQDGCNHCSKPIERHVGVDPHKCAFKLHHACYCEGALGHCKGCMLSFRSCEWRGRAHPPHFVHDRGTAHVTTLRDLVALVRDGDVESLIDALSHVEPGKLFLTRSDSFDDSPLHAACAACVPEAVLVLLHHSAVADAPSRCGWTPLHVVALRGSLTCAQHLLEHGAYVDATDDDGCTPAHKAASLGHADVLALLVRHGAALVAVDHVGAMPLHIAALRGYLDCVQCLLRWMPASAVLAADASGRTAAHAAAAEGHTDILRCLLAACPALANSTCNGETLLQIAGRFRRKACVDLIHATAIPSDACEYVWPIHDAAIAGNVQRVEFYLDNGAPIDGPDDEGNTLLHCACFAGHATLVAALLRRGANTLPVNHEGVTAATLAQLNEHADCRALIVAHDAGPPLPLPPGTPSRAASIVSVAEEEPITAEALAAHLEQRLAQTDALLAGRGMMWPEIAARKEIEAERASRLADLQAELERERITREKLETRRDLAEQQRMVRAARERAARPPSHTLRRSIRPGEQPSPPKQGNSFASPLLLPSRT